MTTLQNIKKRIIEVTIVDKAFLIYILLTVLLIKETPGTGLFYLHLFATVAFFSFTGLKLLRDWVEFTPWGVARAILFALIAMKTLFIQV